MRINFRLKVKNLTIFFMVSQTQTQVGFTSLVKKMGELNSLHIPMFDLEDCNLIEAMFELRRLRKKYNLGRIYVVGENKNKRSFRAWCFTQIEFRDYIKILAETRFIDWLFLKYTILRGKATLRITRKKGRPAQKILGIIWGREDPIPNTMEMVKYDTGLVKSGKTLEIVRE